MTLLRITAEGTDQARVTLWFSDGHKQVTSTSVVAQLGLYQGMTMEDQDMEALLAAVQKAAARDRAVRIVSTTSISERQLKQRLLQRGEEPNAVDEAVDWLKELGAVDDGDMARRIVSQCQSKGYGKNRIRQELYRKGIPREYWDEALENLPDMSDAIDRFLAQRLRGREPDRKELQRAVAALQRRGHGWEEIQSALRRYRDSLEESGWE